MLPFTSVDACSEVQCATREVSYIHDFFFFANHICYTFSITNYSTAAGKFNTLLWQFRHILVLNSKSVYASLTVRLS